MHSIIQNLEVKIYVVLKCKKHKIKNHSDMFRILCDPSSGTTELCLTEIIRSDYRYFVVCLVGVWQRNFEPVVCVCVVVVVVDACRLKMGPERFRPDILQVV